MKLTVTAIAQAGLAVLDRGGLEALTMRQVAAELDVQAPALYWHVRNKRELLDAMAELMFLDATDGLAELDPELSAGEGIAEGARRQRRAMLRHRDGARVYAGTSVTHPAMWRTIETTLARLAADGVEPARAVRVVSTVLHYTVGFVIEEQARTGVDYADNPYRPDRLAAHLDTHSYPMTARALPHLFAEPDAAFEDGLRTILVGAGLPPDPPH